MVYIGKEANNIDEQALKVKKVQVFLDKDEIMQKILDLPQKIAEEWGVRRNTFQGVKNLKSDTLGHRSHTINDQNVQIQLKNTY